MWQGIGETGLGQLLARRFTTPGGAVAPAIAPELFPTIALEVDRPEWGWLKGERLCSTIGASVAGVALQRSKIRLRNPAGSGLIVVVDRVMAAVASGTIFVGISNVPQPNLTTVVLSAARDSRFPFNIGSATQTGCVVSQQSDPAVTLNLSSVSRNIQPGTELVEISGPFILSPGCLLEVFPDADNVTIAATMDWRERGAQPGELV